MDLEEFRHKPAWEHYEASLLNRGFVPAWHLDIGDLPVITCCRCRGTTTHVAMTNDTATLRFFVCQASCGEWIGFPLVEQAGGR
jgi:hypothetical protein